MRLSFLVAKSLLDGDFASYFAKVPSAADDPEPIVLRQDGFECVSRTDGKERGTVEVSVMIVREIAAQAEADSQACERWIRSFGWERHSENEGWRIAGLDTTAPSFKERDRSGRFIWAFDVILTVVRSV